MKFLTLALAAALIGGAANAQTIVGRQVEQQRRIRQGVQSGALTRNEARVLEKREMRLNRFVRKNRVDGAGLNLTERKRINRQQNRLSKQIFRMKRNNRAL